jgi:hypothetical protein
MIAMGQISANADARDKDGRIHDSTKFFPGLKEIFMRVRNIFDFQIPVGFQDEGGFHFGAQPAPQEASFEI